MYAREIVTVAALRGQEHITQQLQRSYSMNDVGSNRIETRTQKNRSVARKNRLLEEELQEDEDFEEEIDDVRSWAGPTTDSSYAIPSETISKASESRSRSSSRGHGDGIRRSARLRRDNNE